MTQRVKIGELLVETGLITQEQLTVALELQKDDPRRLGEIVVSQKMVSESKVTQILSQQLSVPWVSLEYVDFSRQLLNLVTSHIAQEHTLVPIYVRRQKGRKETLHVAIKDPSDSDALNAVSEYSGLPVSPMIAPPSEIRAAIRAYYLGLAPESEAPGSISGPPSSAPISLMSIPPEALLSERAPRIEERERAFNHETAGKATEAKNTLGAAPAEEERLWTDGVEVRDSTMPEPPDKGEGSPDMVTLTMLDGTQLKVPASRRVPQASNGHQFDDLTARDLVEVLRVAADGGDVSAVLGEDVNWQRMFGTLLSLMLKNHVVSDWEFVRELRR